MLRAFPLVVALALCACSRSTPATANTDNTAAAAPGAQAVTAAQPDQQAAVDAAPKPVPAQLPDVIARVNGEAISKADFEKAVRNIEANVGRQVPPEQRDKVYRDVLDELIGYRLLIQEGRNRKIVVSEGEVDKQIEQIRAQFPSEETFKQVMTEQGVTLEQLRTDTRNDLMVRSVLEAEINPKVAVSAAQVDEFYKNNPAQFQQPERVRASHILIGFPQGADEAAKQKARAQAAEVLKQVKAGQDFAALAKQYSSDPGSAQQGGDLGFFQQGQMVPPFDQAAFSMKPGETSELVETDFGVHIIRVVERQPGRTVPLEEVRPQVVQYLEGQSRQAETLKFVEGLKAKGMVEILI